MPKKPRRPSMSMFLDELPEAVHVSDTGQGAGKAAEAASTMDTAQPLIDTQAKNLSRDNVENSKVQGASRGATREASAPDRDGYRQRVRYEKPHVSVYAHPKVFKAIRGIALENDCKPHDLYLEGLRLMLRAHGRDFDALNRGED